ncbi:MAG: hypothetical protein JNK35_14525, partial [Phycisphaerae bacterium]|nr:hypothetical protein [Phycisphaerae bacterium]
VVGLVVGTTMWVLSRRGWILKDVPTASDDAATGKTAQAAKAETPSVER